MSRVLFKLLGAFLMVTMLAKFGIIVADPFADLKTGFPKPVLWLAIFVELAVVVLIFCPSRPEFKWVGCLVTFSVFLMVSSARWILGFDSCGCAGGIEIPPMVAVLANLVVIGLLANMARAGNVKLSMIVASLHGIGTATRASLFGAALAALFVSALQWPFLQQRISTYFGIQVVSCDEVQLGDVTVSEPVKFKVKLTNHSMKPVFIVGGGKSCGCITLGSVGQVIPPHDSITMDVEVTPKSTGWFRQRVIYYLNSRRQFVVAADFSGFAKGLGEL